MKHHIPELPSHIISRDCYKMKGFGVTYIWVLSDRGAEIIENQFATAQRIMALKKCSRATAYRIISRVAVRWWITDARDPEAPRCYSALPLSYVKKVEVLPVGNPNFRSGIYQRGIRRRKR